MSPSMRGDESWVRGASGDHLTFRHFSQHNRDVKDWSGLTWLSHFSTANFFHVQYLHIEYKTPSCNLSNAQWRGGEAEKCVRVQQLFPVTNDLQIEYPRSNNGLALEFPLPDVCALEAVKLGSAAFSGESEGTETCVRALQPIRIPRQGH